MQIEEKYTFSNKRQIWRILLSGKDRVIIEERDLSTKEVSFNCLNVFTGEEFFRGYQFDEKVWIGVEGSQDDVIFFHTYMQPGLPVHKGIIAFHIPTTTIIWQNDEYSFLFIDGDKIYAYKETYDGKSFFTLNIYDGSLMESLGNEAGEINIMRGEKNIDEQIKGCLFPEIYNFDESIESGLKEIFHSLKEEFLISGRIEYIHHNNLLLFTFHTVNENGRLSSVFRAVDINTKNLILEETVAANTAMYIPDPFFTKDNLLLLIEEKVVLKVFTISPGG